VPAKLTGGVQGSGMPVSVATTSAVPSTRKNQAWTARPGAPRTVDTSVPVTSTASSCVVADVNRPGPAVAPDNCRTPPGSRPVNTVVMRAEPRRSPSTLSRPF
jgi:hypothetical protein